jgi:hypothetical protein
MIKQAFVMIEVFKTNVGDRNDAIMLVNLIHGIFGDYKASFDLEDCDRILRVKSTSTQVKSSLLINLFERLGFHAEILPDETSPAVPVTLVQKKYHRVPE